MAFRMLAEMRIALYRKLDRLAPAYLVRRRTGDLVGMATHDVELVEYFFAHTVAPFFVAVLVPAVVVGTLGWFGWPMALALVPFLAVVALSPFFARHRIDTLGSRAREAFGDMNAHAVDTIQGSPRSSRSSAPGPVPRSSSPASSATRGCACRSSPISPGRRDPGGGYRPRRARWW